MRRNMENTNSLAQATHSEVLQIKKNIVEILAKLESLALQVHKATFQTLMHGSADISEFFPVERQEQLELFMDRQHPQWESRRMEFYHFLYTIASDIKKGFARGIIKAMFTRQYIASVKWPSFG